MGLRNNDNGSVKSAVVGNKNGVNQKRNQLKNLAINDLGNNIR